MARRVVTVPALFAAAAALLVLSPALALVAGALDLVRRARGAPTVRLLAFALAYLGYEAAGVVAAAWLWLTRPLHPGRWLERNHRLQRWWTASLVRAARPVLGLRLEVELHGDPSPGPLVVASRHVSVVDSLLPAKVLGVDAGMRLRYVLTSGLQLDPCLDIVGHRLPNHFLDRRSDDPDAERAALEALGRGLGRDEAVVIFPEGGLFTPARRDRAVSRLAERGSPRLASARRLRHVLPPRPAGTLALLRAAPEADVAIVAHQGFEPVASLRRLWRALPLTDPVRLCVVRHPRATVPVDDEDRVRWLDDQWAAMDRWLSGEAAAGLAFVRPGGDAEREGDPWTDR